MQRLHAFARIPLLSLTAALAFTCSTDVGAQVARPGEMPVRQEPAGVDRMAPVVPDLSATPQSVELDGRLRFLAQSAASQRLIRGEGSDRVVSVILKGTVSSGALRAIGV